MDIILLENNQLGQVGSTVSVKPGYARNYLFPKNKAIPANDANLAAFESQRAKLEQQAAEQQKSDQSRIDKLGTLDVTINVQASDEGKLYGSVGTREIAEAVTEAGCHLDKSEVLLPEGVIRVLGDYEIHVQLHSQLTGTFQLKVVQE